MPTGTCRANRITLLHPRVRASRAAALAGGCVALNAAVFGPALAELEVAGGISGAAALAVFAASLFYLLRWMTTVLHRALSLRENWQKLAPVLWPLLIYTLALLPFAFVPYEGWVQLSAALVCSLLIVSGIIAAGRPVLNYRYNYFNAETRRKQGHRE